MLTYGFFISPSGKLVLRLRNNRKKAELNLQEVMDEGELNLILTNPKAKKGITMRHRGIVSGAVVAVEQVRNEMRDRGRLDMDVTQARDMVAERLGLGRGVRGEFVTWFEKFIDSKEKKGTRGLYEQTLRKIEQFAQDKEWGKGLGDYEMLRFSDVRLEWLERFEAYCARTAGKNARNIHLRNIRAVFNYAIDYELDIPYPFRRFKIQPEATRKRSLTVEELRELFECEVEDYAEFYRDMFKLTFMLCGINTVDLYNLTEVTKEGRVEYRRAKTGRLYSIKVEPEAMEIIERWRGKKGLIEAADRWTDSYYFGKLGNHALKLIGAERKGRGGRKVNGRWPDISMYWARHSWATIAHRIGVSKDDIALALGHSSGHKTTDIYINEDMERADRANRRVLDWVLYGVR